MFSSIKKIGRSKVVGTVFTSAEKFLNLLREDPAHASSIAGFVVRPANGFDGHNYAGRCKITCSEYAESSRSRKVYELNIQADPTGHDWYIPFTDGQAKSTHVPFNQPNGSLVVTYPMNGCALEVREEWQGNRFYHDSNGKCMSPLAINNQKMRVDYDMQAGPNEVAINKLTSDQDSSRFGANFEHSLVCVKHNDQWRVHATAVILFRRCSDSGLCCIKDVPEVPHNFGEFIDRIPDLQRYLAATKIQCVLRGYLARKTLR